MNRSRTCSICLALAGALITLTPTEGVTQMRRSGGPPEGAARAAPPAVAVPRGAANARSPYAGRWEGSLLLSRGQGANAPRPLRLIFEVADSAKNTYSGATLFPDNGRAPHLETTVTNGEMRWKQKNSGGGFWVYSARLVTPDSIEGSVVLRDWPQLPPGEKPPLGTFALCRR